MANSQMFKGNIIEPIEATLENLQTVVTLNDLFLSNDSNMMLVFTVGVLAISVILGIFLGVLLEFAGIKVSLLPFLLAC